MSEKGMLNKAFDNQPDPGLDKVLDAAGLISKRLFDAETRADLDQKTQLLNFPAFKIQASKIIANGEIPKGRQPYYSLLLGDLDNFKALNTALGYQETDNTALIPVADIFRDSLSREEDRVGAVSRFGGEEFLALLVGTDQEGAKIIAERIQHKVNELRPLGPDQPLGMSIGLVTISPGSDLEAAFENANHAVNAAKEIEGKNQIIAFEDL